MASATQSSKKHQQAFQQNPYQVPYSANYLAPAAQPLVMNHQFHHQLQNGASYASSGAQTISRSKDLHKHFGPALASSRTLKSSQPAQSLVYYEQPSQQAVGPYAMSVALRNPSHKERGPIPMPMMNGGATIGPAASRHYMAAPIDFYQQQPQHKRPPLSSSRHQLSLVEPHARLSSKPLCRCRVMYLGSSVPHITKNGLHGIQEPLKHLYPEEKFSTSSLGRRKCANSTNQTIDISHLSSQLGIDSWLSVWSNGLLLENVDEFGREIKRFFAIESLHYCAAVRYFDTTPLVSSEGDKQQGAQLDSIEHDANNNSHSHSHSHNHNHNHNSSLDHQQQALTSKRGVVRFLPLDAPIFQCPNMMDANHPPVFAAIMRRTTGIKVLECHAFICRRDAASNALVRCCTHAYADFLSARRMSADISLGHAYYKPFGSSLANEEAQPQASRRSPASAARSQSGQYQEVEALVQHHQSSKSSRSKQPSSKTMLDSNNNSTSSVQVRRARRRPAQSLSTGGTNSQEMTHSDENSLEVESEDNYAIISRQASELVATATATAKGQLSSSANQERQVIPTQQQDKQSNSSLPRRRKSREQRRVKGSSKSLFNDFQPHEQARASDGAQTCSSSRNQARDELDRLSHSLDYLQAAATCCPPSACADCNLGDMARHQHQYSTDETNPESIKYSLVSNKQKRHSKSMQQLQLAQDRHNQPRAQQSAAKTMVRNGSLSSRTSRHRHRRAASYQDLAPLAAGSLQRRRDKRGAAGQHSRRSSMSSLQQSLVSGSQELIEQAPSRRPVQNAPNNCIYATCEDDRTTDLRILRADCCAGLVATQARPPSNTTRQTTNGYSSASTTVSKAARHSASNAPSSRRRPEVPLEEKLQELSSQQQLAVDPLASYYQFPAPPPLPLVGPYSPTTGQPIHYGLGPPQPLPPPGAPYYYPAQQQPVAFDQSGAYHLPLPAAYHSHFSQPVYAATPGPYQPATISARHAHQLSHFIAQQQQQHYANAGAMTIGGRGADKHARRLSKAEKEAGKSKSKSQTLATRFRCLSPPVNFLYGGRNSTGQEVAAAAAVEPQQQQQQIAQEDTTQSQNQNRQSVSSIASSQAPSERISPSGIVSGQPGFLAGGGCSSSTKLTTTAATATTTTTRQQKARPVAKMSWIKRLSLTLSSGGGGGGLAAAGLSSNPRGSVAQDKNQLAPSKAQGDGLAVESQLSGGQLLADQVPGELSADVVANTASRHREQDVGQEERTQAQAADGQQQQQQNTSAAVEDQTSESGLQEANKAQEKKSKRKGIFSGTLTLGRRSKTTRK